MVITNDNKLIDLLKLSIELNEVQDVDILLENILTGARKFLNADAGTIMIKERDELVFSHSQNDTMQCENSDNGKSIYNEFRTRITKSSLAGYVALSGKILNIPDAYSIPEDVPYHFNHSYDDVTGYKTISILTVPLQTSRKDIIGVMQIINAKDEKGEIIPFNKDDELYLLHFASSACVIIQRAMMTRILILRMISMAELRDPMETGPHVNRVAAYSVELYERWARKKGINEDKIKKNKDLLRIAAMLHDVGKVAISDLLLKKPERFTKEEFELIKKHTVYGALLFKMKQSDFDEISAIVALNHHENWDGTGYPGHIDIETGEPLRVDMNGNAVPKKGEEIHIFGRIVALADVFDALSSKRVYKKAWDRKRVIKEIIKLKGKKFDPELVDIFIDYIQVFENIKNKYPNNDKQIHSSVPIDIKI